MDRDPVYVKACRACERKIIFLNTRKGSKMPVDYKPDLKPDDLYSRDRHVSHFDTCPKAGEFRRGPK